VGALSEAQRVELNRRIAAWRLSTLMYGEQGAMLACSQLVDVVEARSQVLPGHPGDGRGRHNEVLDRYLTERVGIRYGVPKNERDLFDSILTESAGI